MLVEAPSKSFNPSQLPTNIDFDNAFRKVDGTNCVTAAGPEKPGKVFTQSVRRQAVVVLAQPLAGSRPHHHREQDGEHSDGGRGKLATAVGNGQPDLDVGNRLAMVPGPSARGEVSHGVGGQEQIGLGL